MNLDTLIEAKRVGEEVIPVVNLRSLHTILEVKRKFADWAKDRVKHYTEGRDFCILSFSNPSLDKNGKKRASTSKEYYVSLEIAKSVVKDKPVLVEFFEEKQHKLEPEKCPSGVPIGLVSVKEEEIGGKKVQTVSAKELYKTLGLEPAHWARWAKQNIEDNPFAVEGEDYIKEGNTFLLSPRFSKIITMNTMTKEASELKAKMLERDEKATKLISSLSKIELDFSGSILSYKDGDLYITSLAIASLTGKEHFHVIRDIREETLKIQEEIDLSKSGLISGNDKETLAYKEILRGVRESHYLDEQGRRYPCYELSESAAYQMMLKYSFKFRALVIYEFQQMRKNLLKMMQASLIENAFPELAVEKQHVYVIRNTLTGNLKIGVSKEPEKYPEEEPIGLVSVKEQEIGGKKVQTVSAKELYKTLGLDITHWARWSKQNIKDNPFAIEGEDYALPDQLATEASKRGSEDYTLSLAFAKKLAMTVKTYAGEMVRNYFLECEAKLQKKEEEFSAKDRYMLDIIYAKSKEEAVLALQSLNQDVIEPLEQKVDELEEGIRKANLQRGKALYELVQQHHKSFYYDLILNTPDLLTATEVAADYGISAKDLNKILEEEKIQYKKGG